MTIIAVTAGGGSLEFRGAGCRRFGIRVFGRIFRAAVGSVSDRGTGQFDAVSSLPLREVERGVREAFEPVRSAGVLGVARDTDRCRDFHVGARKMDLADCRADARHEKDAFLAKDAR